MKKIKLLFTTGLLVSVLSFVTSAQSFLDTRLKHIDGSYTSIREASEHNIIILDFWATWCKPCLEELSEFQKIYDDYKEKGFKIRHFGDIIHAKFHGEYGKIVDKVQIKIYTTEKNVSELVEIARETYNQRDIRLADMTDESVDTFYSCTICQSYAPDHVCVITPQRLALRRL